MSDLPIFAVRSAFVEALARGPVVLSSPTGSGKSTEVPRWCEGRVLVVEPRRIACRSLATRIAEREGTKLGTDVGYVVRDERVMDARTRIVFATPGLVLRDRSLLASAHTVVLDEFHERSLDLDLLLALLLRDGRRALVVMSATLSGERIAQHLGGVHIRADGSAFPVDIRYEPGAQLLPSGDDLPRRLRDVLARTAHDPGDILVFLPGKSEIEQCAQALQGGPYHLLRLHGGLDLDEQRRVFEGSARRKLILATNVAETSLTIPGIGVVIDAGLVRQVRYQAGRGSLALVPVAADSATQRTGRAGRTGPGVCYRLWSPSAKLEPQTLPELYRESLVPLVLGAAAWGATPEELPFLDPPKAHALEAARADLCAWGALSPSGALSENGRGLFALPVAPLHAQLLAQAQAADCLDDMIDLVAVLSVGRPLFSSHTRGDDDSATELRCDATRLVHVLRAAGSAPTDVSSAVLHEARAQRRRLRRLLQLPEAPPVAHAFDREAVIRAALKADPRMVYVARPRGRDVYFSNGGTEIELARESTLQLQKKLDALLVLDTRAFGAGREARVLITCGMPIPLSTIARAGLAQDRIASVSFEQKRVVCEIERVYAKIVVAVLREEPSGAVLREALAMLLERGSLFRDAVASSRQRLLRTSLASALASRAQPAAQTAQEPTLASFLRGRLAVLGVEAPDDVALLSAGDFLVPELPDDVRAALDQDYPASVNIGDATYRADYDIAQHQVILQLVKGQRREPPPLSYLPRFPGLRVCVAGPRGTLVLRPRTPVR